MADSVETTAPDDAGSSGVRLSAPIIALISALAGVIYCFSNPTPNKHWDYTFRMAGRFLQGSIGFTEPQPPWLNEFVPYGSYFYSVFPFGSVLTMIPAALLKAAGLITDMPSAAIAALIASAACALLLTIALRYDIDRTRAILMTLGMVFGTWVWTNITVGGAWQFALGFAMIGELGALYFTLFDRRPILAGLFFALAFGNRTEVLLTAPLFMYLLARGDQEGFDGAYETGSSMLSRLCSNWLAVAGFCLVPFFLGVWTLWYNYARFGSPTDFGYARIPGVLQEPWYSHGIFSYRYIPGQMWEMLVKPWVYSPTFPYYAPDRFSSSIVWSSPFILFAFRTGARDKILKYLCWGAILVLCVILWMHGNSGGWQFGYRYATVCLPFLFVIMLESSSRKVTPLEWAAYIFAFVANAYATWLFHWTPHMK
jgi:hypothetical protein